MLSYVFACHVMHCQNSAQRVANFVVKLYFVWTIFEEWFNRFVCHVTLLRFGLNLRKKSYFHSILTSCQIKSDILYMDKVCFL